VGRYGDCTEPAVYNDRRKLLSVDEFHSTLPGLKDLACAVNGVLGESSRRHYNTEVCLFGVHSGDELLDYIATHWRFGLVVLCLDSNPKRQCARNAKICRDVCTLVVLAWNDLHRRPPGAAEYCAHQPLEAEGVEPTSADLLQSFPDESAAEVAAEGRPLSGWA
jgi:hypothetical protein